MAMTPDNNESAPSDAVVQQVARQVLKRYEGQQGALLPILHAVQHALGYIPAAIVPLLGEALQLSRAEIHGVVSFYPHFRETPAAPIVLEICRAEACQSMGGDALAEHAKNKLGCDFHSTASNGAVTLEPVYCLGLCAQSPTVMINGQPHARMTPAKLDQLLQAQEA
jgi:formate dehydrogenase subunit gamma